MSQRRPVYFGRNQARPVAIIAPGGREPLPGPGPHATGRAVWHPVIHAHARLLSSHKRLMRPANYLSFCTTDMTRHQKEMKAS